ncbi:GDSL esterase/lipase APG [Capsicum chinense]|nr:GDSL esterase/lipase APG [Capsicum chinense]
MELCRECENTEALYRKGVLDYFKDDEPEVALEFLKRAENGGHVGACFGTKTTHWLQHQQRSRKNVWSSDTEDEDDGHSDFHCNACSCDVEIAHIWQSDALDFTTYRSSAYLSPQASSENLLIGANFATAGAGYKTSILNELYGQGARRIGVTSLPPLGCLPAVKTLFGFHKSGCISRINRDAQHFNKKMNSSATKLRKQLPGLKIARFDVFQPIYDLVKSPSDHVNFPYKD